MAHTSGMTTLIGELLERGHEFSFVQVMRLARRYLDPEGEAGIPGIPWQERVRIRPELSLAFPAADVAKVERQGEDLLVTATFLGLYGPASPLPTFYTEDLMDEASGDETVFRDFLDIIHQRLYHLYFECWSKYRLSIRIIEENNPIDRERLLCLIGLGERELSESIPDSYNLLRYAGILTQHPRSATGLAAMLRDMLGMKGIRIMQNVKRMVPIPPDQRMRLGLGNCHLGIDTVLGSEIADRMGKIRIRIGPLSWREFNDHLPGTARHEKLTRYTRFYLTDPLEVDVELALGAGEARPIVLGDPEARLGLNTWCFSGDSLGEVSAVFRMEAMPGMRTPRKVGRTPRQSRTFVDHYREERAALDRLAARYVEEHPNLAPMMSGPLADQGVERLFEGTAFLNALLRQKLEDDIPEFIHEVMGELQPEHLRPVPAMTVVAFTPKANLTEPQIIPRGTHLDSIPVDGTACRFTTCFPVEVQPLVLLDAFSTQIPGKYPQVSLKLELRHLPLADWPVRSLRLYLAGECSHAADLYLLLTRHLKRIIIEPEETGEPAMLDATHLKPVGFSKGEMMIPSMHSGTWELAREYFILSDKYLFLDLVGLETWHARGQGARFEIRFELENAPFPPRRITLQDFALNAAPALNLFPQEANPIFPGKQIAPYRITPAAENPGHYEIYSIENVTATLENALQEMPLARARLGDSRSSRLPAYQVTHELSPVRGKPEAFLHLERSGSVGISRLEVKLACTNGTLPERLGPGEICQGSDTSPNFATFSNCKPVASSFARTPEGNYLWRLLSVYVSNISFFNAESLRRILKLISLSAGKNQPETIRNEKRIDGISDIRIQPSDRLLQGRIRRGWSILIKLDADSFSSGGDLYLFGAVLEEWLREFVSESCFARTVVEVAQGGLRYEWPAKMGKRPLL